MGQRGNSKSREVDICMWKKNEMVGVCSTYGGERRGAYRVLLGRAEGERPLARLKHRWEDNVTRDLQDV